MKMSGPIIITVPNNYLAVEDVDSGVVVDVSPQPSRKRRLDHLTWEEKMQRKKLKNRVAAQTSRDRKKAKMDDMESRLQRLAAANEQLAGEVRRLQSENEALRAARPVPGAPRPAEPPRQKGGPPAAARAALLLALSLLAPTCSSACTPTPASTRCSSSLTPYSKKLMQLLQKRLNMSLTGSLESGSKPERWWGPQQSTWNPVAARG